MAGKTKSFTVDTEFLEFDRRNPRLVELDDMSGASDQQIMCALVEQADIGELVQSIVANTYLDIEPLIVIREGAGKNRFRVLEGNRRLAAIRFLQTPDTARKCRLSIPKDISEEVYKSLKEVTVYEVKQQSDSQAFIAFKHINGAHRWDAYAKARYVTDWYIKGYDKDITIDDIANKVGDKNQFVRSIISGMLVLKQAEKNEIFEIADRKKTGKFGFSHLYTALGRLEYRQFLGLKKDWNLRPSPTPVDKKYLPKLKEVLRFIYGSKQDGIESVIKSQNPDLKRLGQVLVHPVALGILRSTNKLDLAEEEVRPAEDVFHDALIIAYSRVQDALKKVSKFSPDKTPNLMTIAEEMSEISSNIILVMRNKMK